MTDMLPPPTSVNDPEVQTVLDRAQQSAQQRPPEPVTVMLDNQDEQVPPPYPSPQEWRDQWIYFLMVDRFNNSPENPPNHPPFDSIFVGFQGGTFNGVRDQLPYLQDLGVGALWLSPVIKNCPFEQTYHGYGIQDFLRVEPRFASNPNVAEHELRALVDAAHDRNIYVIFDIVLNHTGDVFAYALPGQPVTETAPFSQNIYPIAWRDTHGNPHPEQPRPEDVPRDLDDTVWPEELRHNEVFRKQGEHNGNGLIGDFDDLRQIITGNAAVQNVLIRAYQYLIAKYNIDGFRIDTFKFIDPAFARLFASAIREFALTIGKKNFFIFGEVAGSEQDIAKFIGRNTTTSDGPIGADAALDFPLFNKLPWVAKGLQPPNTIAQMYAFRRQVEQPILSTHGEASNDFVTFLDNHDQSERFYFSPPDAAHAHDFDDQVTLGLACLFALQGIPCVYYGTEQGLHGHGAQSGEPVREALWGAPNAFDHNHPFYQAIQRLAQLRDDQPALRYGRQYFRPVSGDHSTFGISPFAPGVLAFSRILSNQEIVVVANTTQVQQSLAVIVDFSLNATGGHLNILFPNKPIPAPTAPGPVREISGGNCTIFEADGITVTHGPVRYIDVTLRPMEVQILGR